MSKRRFLERPHVWAFTTYFAEGFPFTMIRTVSSVFFRDMKVSLEGVGLTSLYGLPWILKFLWSPALDTTATKRRWLLLTQSVLLLLIVAAAAVIPLKSAVPLVATLFFFGAIVAATHDIAIDGYYMEALDEDGQARYVGYRVMAYRIAMMTGTGVIVTIGARWGWTAAFWAAAAVFGLVFCYHLFFLPEPEDAGRPFSILLRRLVRIRSLLLITGLAASVMGFRMFHQSALYRRLSADIPFLSWMSFPQWIGILLLIALVLLILMRRQLRAMLLKNPDSQYSRAFLTFIDRDAVGPMLGFIITLRAGEWMLTTMVAPFMVDLGIKVHYGWIAAAVGLPCSIAGAMLGGWLISKYSLRRTIWPLIAIQNATNIVYMFLAFHLQPFIALNTGNAAPTAIGNINLAMVAGVHGFEQLSAGLGTAVLMTYLMRICTREFKASHYAIGSGLMNVSGLFAGVSSGFLASWLGYGWMFGCAFLVAVPAMLLIPFIPMVGEKNPADPK